MSDTEQRPAGTIARLERNVESVVKRPIREIREEPIDAQRRRVEIREGRPTTYEVRFPTVGRGNVMRDRTKSREEVESLLDAALDRV